MSTPESASHLAASLESLIVGLTAQCKLDAPHPGPELSFPESRVLMVVGGSPAALPIHGIAEQLGFSIATAGRTVDRLVREGIVARTECAEDRRVKLVSVTELGRRLLSDHLEAHHSVLLAFAAGIPAQQRTALDRAIRDALQSNQTSHTSQSGQPPRST